MPSASPDIQSRECKSLYWELGIYPVRQISQRLFESGWKLSLFAFISVTVFPICVDNVLKHAHAYNFTGSFHSPLKEGGSFYFFHLPSETMETQVVNRLVSLYLSNVYWAYTLGSEWGRPSQLHAAQRVRAYHYLMRYDHYANHSDGWGGRYFHDKYKHLMPYKYRMGQK